VKNCLLVLVVSCVLAACSGTVTLKPVERGTVPIVDNATHGVLVGSAMFSGVYEGEAKTIPFGGIGSRRFRCQVYSMRYRSVDDREPRIFGNLSAIPSGGARWKPSDPRDYEVDKGLGFVNAIVLPAGKYEVWNYSTYCGVISYGMDGISVPFEVTAGQASYLGEIQYRHEFNESLGIGGFDGSSVRVVDKMERDLPLLLERYSFLSDYEIVPLAADWRRLYVPIDED